MKDAGRYHSVHCPARGSKEFIQRYMRQSNKSAMTSLATLLLLAHLALAAAAAPTVKPSLKPTVRPTLSPTLNPSAIPTGLPTDAPTSLPTVPTAFVPDYTKIKTWTYIRDSISTCDGITVPCGVNYWVFYSI